MQARKTANWALGIVTAGYFAALPYDTTFWGGLCSNTFGAAMVGGVADWYAITGLFEKPLGIPWKTRFIPSQYPRLVNMMVDMVQNELLTTDNIRRTLQKYNLPTLAAHHLLSPANASHLQTAISDLFLRLLRDTDRESLCRSLAKLARPELNKILLSPLLASSLQWLCRHDHDRHALSFLCRQLQPLAQSAQTRDFFYRLFQQVLHTYERGRLRRQIFDSLLGLHPHKAAEEAQAQLLLFLENGCQDNHPIQLWLRKQLVQAAADLQTASPLSKKVEKWKKEWLARPDFLPEKAALFLNQLLPPDQSGSFLEKRLPWFSQQVQAGLQSLLADQKTLQQWDQRVKESLLALLRTHSSFIGDRVRENLASRSPEEMSGKIRAKTGKDLQMIRINGSVAGGLLGLCIFLVEQVLS